MNGANDISISKQLKSVVDNSNNTSEAKGSINIDKNFMTEKAVGRKKKKTEEVKNDSE